MAAPPRPLPAKMRPFARPRLLLKYCEGMEAITYDALVKLACRLDISYGKPTQNEKLDIANC